MRVIKLGGSLMSDQVILRQCLTTIELKVKDQVVIVPGGGVFAEQVRLTQQLWKFDDDIAHHMAILAMQQMALLLKSIKPKFVLTDKITDIKKTQSIVIWSPNIQLLDKSGVKASWDVSSDSLSAWLATQILADELILVKSAPVPVQPTLYEMQCQGIVDKAFQQFTQHANYHIILLNKHGFNEHIFT